MFAFCEQKPKLRNRSVSEPGLIGLLGPLRASAIETDVTVARAHARGDEVTNFYVAT